MLVKYQLGGTLFCCHCRKKGRRKVKVVLMVFKLYQLLLGAFDLTEEGKERICPVSRYGLWQNFQVYRKRTGLEKWKDAFKVLRRNSETDWDQEYPQYAVSIWMGHDIQVSTHHYLQVPAELYNKVAAANEVGTGTKTGTNCKTVQQQQRRGSVSCTFKKS